MRFAIGYIVNAVVPAYFRAFRLLFEVDVTDVPPLRGKYTHARLHAHAHVVPVLKWYIGYNRQ